MSGGAFRPDRGSNTMNSYNVPWWGWVGVVLLVMALVGLMGALMGLEDPTPNYRPQPVTTSTGTDRP